MPLATTTPMGPNGILGEVSPQMAAAVSGAEAAKILIPSASCEMCIRDRLWVARRPMEGQAAIVMEPTDEMIQPAHRAGLWLKMECEGVSTHTAAMHQTGLSGFELALRAIERLREMHAAYREECRKNPPQYYEDYLPVFNVGMFHTGEWPAAVPRRAVVHCSVGVPPNLHTADMKPVSYTHLDVYKRQVIMYSSDLLEIVGLADRVLAMYEGRVVSEIRDDAITEESVMLASVGISSEEGSA